jgi:hypothetical protein
MKRAFKFWTDAADLRITETTGTTDIVIRFENGDHGDGYPFDGQGIFLYYEYEYNDVFESNGGTIRLEARNLRFVKKKSRVWVSEMNPAGFLQNLIHCKMQ